MKRKAIILSLLISCGWMQLQAQFFKKLKDKVTNVVDKATAPPANTTASATNNQVSSPAQINTNTPIVDFAKYNISATVAYNPGDLHDKTFYFEAGRTVYKVVSNTVTADVVVYGTNRQMGEAGEMGPGDNAYIFENGKMIAQKKVSDIENDDALKAAYSARDWPYNYSGNMTKYCPDGNPAHVNFHGQSYSNYMVVMALQISKDESKLYGVGGQNAGGNIVYYFFSSDGKKIKLPGLANSIMFSPDFSNACVYGFVNRLQGEQDKQGGNVLKAAGNVLNGGDVYFIDGSVTKNASATANAYLDISGKNILQANRFGGNYINGKKISDQGSEQGNLWCSADGNRWAYYGGADGTSGGHLVFYDGADIPNAQHPQQFAVNGKTYMVWLQTRNRYNGDLLVCTKEL